MIRISLAIFGKTLYQTTEYIKIFETVQKSNRKIIKKKLQNKTIHLPSYIFKPLTMIPQASFFIHFDEPLPLV